MQKMVLYHNNQTLTIKERRELRHHIEHLKKRARNRLVITGIGVVILSTAIIKMLHYDAPSVELAQLNPIPISTSEEDTNFLEEETVLEDAPIEDEIEQYFDYYCSIYQVNKDIVYQKAKELTDSFTNTEWVYNHNVPGTRVIRQERSYDSQELGVLSFVRHMKQIPTDFGFTKEELATNQTYVLDITYEEFTEKQCMLFQKFDSTLCQAIQYHETGYYSSSNFLERNNPAGLIDKSTNDYWQFQNPAEGILELLIQLEVI